MLLCSRLCGAQRTGDAVVPFSKSWAPRKECDIKRLFQSYTKTYDVGTQKNRLKMTVLLGKLINKKQKSQFYAQITMKSRLAQISMNETGFDYCLY